jgi:hypothetical protein
LNSLRVLLDLKPALDGYAGIPQETRLLFAALRKLGRANVEGLIQHGGRRLRGGLPNQSATLSLCARNVLFKIVHNWGHIL